MSPQKIHDFADELLDAHDRARLIPSIVAREPGFGMDAGYRLAAELIRRRSGRGSMPVGRKIGFTNRGIWPQYSVNAPMWAHVYNDTVIQANDGNATVSLAGMLSPLMEPEICFKLRAPLPAGCQDARRLLEAVEWYAHSVEVVHSHFDWKFALAEAVADWGCHARLVLGEPQAFGGGDIDALARDLPLLHAKLYRNGELQAEGRGANVLDSPALALGFLADVIAKQPFMAPLAAGEIITTGTLTAALPVRPGETWSTAISGLPAQNLTIAYTA